MSPATTTTHFVTTAKAASELRVSQQHVRRLCARGIIDGAVKAFGRGDWMIPVPITYINRRRKGRPLKSD